MPANRPVHLGIRPGRRYAMPGKDVDPLDSRYEQYGDRADDPARKPGEYIPLTRIARFFEYRLTTLNLAGAFPRVQGLAPFASDPYGYRWEHLDEWGRLGKFEWTARTQLLPLRYPFPLHRAFIPFDVVQFDFDPKIHLLQAQGPNPGLRSLAYAFLGRARTAAFVLLRSMRRIDRMTSRFHFVLPSNYDPDWHFGASWMDLLQKGMTPAPAWKIAHIAEEIRRRLMDGAGFVTMALRVLLYLWCYKERLQTPRFRTTLRLAGLITSESDHRSRLIAEGLAELGVPVWTIKIKDESPHPELYPRGTTKDSHWWKEAEREAQVKHPLWDLKSDYAQKDIREKFEAKLKEQIKRRLANPPEDVWVMEKGHAAEATRPGPRHVYHPSYFRKPQGPEGERYLEGMIRWLTQVTDGNYMTVLLELQEVLGKPTLSLEKLPERTPYPPLLPILHENYSLCEDWALWSGCEWRRPPPFPTPEFRQNLRTRLIDPAMRTHGAAPELLERMAVDDPLYPSVPRSERRARARSPEERRVRQRREEEGGGDLEAYETGEPLDADEDFTAPEGMQDVVPTSSIDSSRPELEGDAWETPNSRTDRFPVELSPFVYLGPREQLEDELLERYGSGAPEWLYEEPRLVLVFADKDRALRAIKNQKQAARVYPSEAPARAVPYGEGSFLPWGPQAVQRASHGVEVRRNDRLIKCPIPNPVLVRGGWTRPADAVFKTNYLAQLLHPGGLPVATSSPQVLMSRYFVSPSIMLFFLENRTTKLVGIAEAYAGPALDATRRLRDLLQCHLSYDKPAVFSVPLPFAGMYRDALTWVAQELPPVDPTSISARGTFPAEVLRWNGFYERYEIVLDDLQLEDVGLLVHDS
jgi:hypothetical protein